MAIILSVQLTACGTIFYPERKGQISGRIDPLVAFANAAGLLFFFIPGIIAFAVDFTTGAIYLPHGKRSSLTPEELKSVTESDAVNIRALNEILSKKIGQPIDVTAANIQISPLNSTAALPAYFQSMQLAKLPL